MRKWIFIFAICSIFISCSKNQDNYIQNETEFYRNKIEYFGFKFAVRNELNSNKIAKYYDLRIKITDSLSTLRDKVTSSNNEITSKKLDAFKSFISSNENFEDDLIHEIILPNRIDKWLNDETEFHKETFSIELFKLDMLKLECELLEFLYNSIEKDYFKFNKLIPVVTSQSNRIKLGDTYSSKVYIAGIDTLQYPIILVTGLNEPDSLLKYDKVDNKTVFNLKVIEGIGQYKMKPNTKGINGFKGVIQYPGPNGYRRQLFFTKEFLVE